MDTRPLRDLAALNMGANLKVLAKPHLGQELPLITIKDVNQSLTAIEELPRVTADPAAVRRFLVRPSDVVVTTRGTAIRAAVVEPSHAGAIAGANLAIVRVRSELAPALLAAFLREPRTQKALLYSTAGAVTPGFTIKALGDLPIRVPSRERQQILVNYLAAADAHRKALMRALELRQLASESLIALELSASEAL